ncbi:MAG: dephospho-CoA kinase [Firmicutes bacterium]|nr:dephospho-CoA kinase [Bacillota bacterium]
MKIIGLTGGTGSGKSIVAAALGELGAYIIDADQVAREVMEPGQEAYNEIVAHFGTGILNPDKTILRHALGDIVFNDRDELMFLNSCTHKYISLEIMDRAENAKASPELYSCIVIDAPQLIEAKMTEKCDEIWVVSCPDEIRINRITERDGITREQAESRIRSQFSQKIYESFADVIIYNDTTHEEVYRQVKERFKK